MEVFGQAIPSLSTPNQLLQTQLERQAQHQRRQLQQIRDNLLQEGHSEETIRKLTDQQLVGYAARMRARQDESFTIEQLLGYQETLRAIDQTMLLGQALYNHRADCTRISDLLYRRHQQQGDILKHTQSTQIQSPSTHGQSSGSNQLQPSPTVGKTPEQQVRGTEQQSQRKPQPFQQNHIRQPAIQRQQVPQATDTQPDPRCTYDHISGTTTWFQQHATDGEQKQFWLGNEERIGDREYHLEYPGNAGQCYFRDLASSSTMNRRHHAPASYHATYVEGEAVMAIGDTVFYNNGRTAPTRKSSEHGENNPDKQENSQQHEIDWLAVGASGHPGEDVKIYSRRNNEEYALPSASLEMREPILPESVNKEEQDEA
jgi:hypothetical protein